MWHNDVAMKLLVRAVITGFGLKIGAEIANFVSNKFRARTREDLSEAHQTQETQTTPGVNGDLPPAVPPDTPIV